MTREVGARKRGEEEQALKKGRKKDGAAAGLVCGPSGRRRA